jgi:hypothetical protein
MSNGYTKLFASILHSTVWAEPLPTRIVWITMLAMCDQHGAVLASVPGLARAAGVTRQEVDIALKSFLSPDPDSRTKDFDGRRIEAVDGGWELLNHGKYRELMSTDDIRRKAADRQRRYRDKRKTGERNEPSRNVTRNMAALLVASVTTCRSDTDKRSNPMSTLSTLDAVGNNQPESSEELDVCPLDGEPWASGGKVTPYDPSRHDVERHDARGADAYDYVTGKRTIRG